jgi:hypothetical protein
LTGKGGLLCPFKMIVSDAGPSGASAGTRAVIVEESANEIAKVFSPIFADLSDWWSPKRSPRIVSSAPRAIAESASAEGVLLAAFTTPLREISGDCPQATTAKQISHGFIGIYIMI